MTYNHSANPESHIEIQTVQTTSPSDDELSNTADLMGKLLQVPKGEAREQ